MATYHRISVRRLSTLLSVCVLLGALASLASAQDTTPRWRAVWIDTFNTRLGTADEVATAVARVAAAHANVIFVQVRRRGDAFYLDGNEPAPEGAGLEAGFDPLAEVLTRARAAGLDVHAMLTLGPVWHQSTSPLDSRHVFVQHGFRNGRAVEGADNWLTRTLQPDGNGTSVDGYRFGNDFWLDFGHPAAAAYVVDVVTRLVARYPVDGIHLDGLHYPEAPSGTASVGYNAVAVSRYQQRSGTTGTPGQDDGRWSAWRREQITALTRRLALSVWAERPSVIVTVEGIGTGAAPGDPRGTVAYSRSFQDWFAWVDDGSVDAIVAHVFRAEHQGASADEFRAWTTWVRGAAQRRPVVVGLGAYLNSAEGLVRQLRLALDASAPTGGVALFSLAANNAPVVNNPLSNPPGRDTPQRSFEDLGAVFRTGRTAGGQTVDPQAPPVFAAQVPRPALPWKDEVGHLLGRLEDSSGAVVDGAQIRLETGGGRTGPDDVVSDGSGVFAIPAVAPGRYRVQVTSSTGSAFTSECTVDVTPRAVSRLTLVVDANRAGVAVCR